MDVSMKIIFLDIDGVLNSREYDRNRDYTKQTNIDETRLPYVKQIVDKTGAAIVLSSTWRRHWSSNRDRCDGDGLYMTDLFAKYGLTIYDKTPDGNFVDRHDEIKHYMLYSGEPISSFVIIDDYGFGWGEFSDRFVKTDPYGSLGIDEDVVKRAVEILNN